MLPNSKSHHKDSEDLHFIKTYKDHIQFLLQMLITFAYENQVVLLCTYCYISQTRGNF